MNKNTHKINTIWVISDTHTRHSELSIPDNCDTVIHCGDYSNSREYSKNLKETFSFCEWFKELPMPNKIVSPGNHDVSLLRKFPAVEDFAYMGITLLMHDRHVSDCGLKFFASMFTPSYSHGWAFNVKRHKIGELWKEIPDDTEILITHGMPFGILDKTFSMDRKLEQVGCKSLRNRCEELKDLKYYFGGHIHDEKNACNFGIYKGNGPTYINASCYVNKKKRFNNGIVLNLGRN